MSIDMSQERTEQADVELWQFPYSIYNEKVRWALDLKCVPHRRRNLLPGPHAVTVKRLTGQTQVPVLRMGQATIHGSARIIDVLERQVPTPALYPADPELRRRALQIQAWFDEVVGPPLRLALFAHMLAAPEYVSRMFTEDRGPVARVLYRACSPVWRQLMKRSMGITSAEAVERALASTEQGLDFVAREAGTMGVLVGDTFTVADLAAAAILSPTVTPPIAPMSLPEPRPPVVLQWLERWVDHAGTAWVAQQYRRHRGRPAGPDAGSVFGSPPARVLSASR